MSRKVQLRSDLNPPSSVPSGKRPRANEDHEASIPEAKARKLDKGSISLKDIVPPLAPGLAQPLPVNCVVVVIWGDPSIPGSHKRSINRKNDAVRPVPVNRDPSTPGPHMGSFTVETQSPAARPVPTHGNPSTPGPHIGSFAVGKNDNIIIAHTEKPTVNETQTISQVPKTTSHRTTASEHLNPPTTYRDNESAASKAQRTNEARGPIPIRNACGEPSEPSLPLQDNRVSKAHAQPSVSTAALAHSRSSTLLHDLSRWIPTPYILVETGEDKKLCPRVEAFPDDGLSQVLGVGQHPIATAIARIHSYGYENSLPKKACHILKTFDDIYRCYHGSLDITLLDPLLYNSDTYSQTELEAFREKEWAWLVRAGKPITFPGRLPESWDFVTIQSNYQRLKVALVLSRDDELMTYLPGCPPAQDLEPIQLYESPPRDYPNPVPQLTHRALEDIAFCQRWIPKFTSEDICAVIKCQYQPALVPHHIDEIARATFRGSQSLDCIDWVMTLRPLVIATRKARIVNVRLQAGSSYYNQLSIFGW